MQSALFSPLSRRAGIGYWSYRLPGHLSDLEPGALAAVPFSGQLVPAVVVERGAASDTEDELKAAVGKISASGVDFDLGSRILRLHREFGSHPVEAARWLGLGGNRPLLREFFFAPSRGGYSTHSTRKVS